jgi:hypothetical protein
MPKFIYGTDESDFIGVFRFPWFDRYGVTDGDDTIYGLGGDDWIDGHDGNDFLQGGEGADLLIGGDDIDTAGYGDSPSGVTVDLQTGIGQGALRRGIGSFQSRMSSARGGTIICMATPMTMYCPDLAAMTSSSAALAQTHSMAVWASIRRVTPTPLPA